MHEQSADAAPAGSRPDLAFIRRGNTNHPTETLYDGFMSYRHSVRQSTIARALQRGLHGFAKPWYRVRAVRLYRDETNLGARPDLWGAIEIALDRSRFLLLMASPEAAASPWVEKEIAHWLRTKGEGTLLIVLTNGVIIWDAIAERFDSQTTALPGAALAGVTREPFWIDLTWVVDPATDLSIEHPRFRDAVASIAATLRGTDKDAIAGEDLRQRRRALRLAWAGAAALAVLAGASLIAGALAIRQGEEARREQERATQWSDRRLFTISLILARQVEGDRGFTTVDYNPYDGLTFGMYLGWNQAVGRLHQLLAAMRAADQALFDEVFADRDSALAGAMLTYSRGGFPFRERASDPRFDFANLEWQQRFQRAGSLPTFQRVQLDLALKDFLVSRRLLETQMPELTTERSLAFMLDVITQHGRSTAVRFYREARAKGSESAILEEIARLSTQRAGRPRAQIVERRRELFRTTPFLLDEPLGGAGLPHPSWSEDVSNWLRRSGRDFVSGASRTIGMIPVGTRGPGATGTTEAPTAERAAQAPVPGAASSAVPVPDRGRETPSGATKKPAVGTSASASRNAERRNAPTGSDRTWARGELERQVRALIVEHLGIEASKVTSTASFIDDLGADSLDVRELVLAFEEKFEINLPDETLERIVTVADAEASICGLLGGQCRSP